MKKSISYIKQIGLVAVIIFWGQMNLRAQTLVGQTLDAVPGDAFTYQSQSMPNYGIKWTSDLWATGAATAWLSSYHGFKFFTWGSPKMALTREGNLGIGTTNPADKLNVNPQSRGGILIGAPQTPGSTTLEMIISAAEGGHSLIQSVKSSGSEYGVLALNPTAGNVGIGTTTPGEKLAVNGRILAKEIKVISGSTTSWPDYVFKPTYQLRPLPELEKFIKTHQHLPEVPSAKEVAVNGIEVGANQALLLKKIEEITLHLIELNKKVEELQQENQALKKSNKKR